MLTTAETTKLRTIIKLTPTGVRDYLACPEKYSLQYIQALGPKALVPSPALALGSSVHAALDALHRPWPKRSAISDVEKLLRQVWQSGGYVDADQEKEYFEAALQMLNNYVQAMGTPAGKVLGTELFLRRQTTIAGHPVELACKADRVELLPDGTLEILDYKTNASGEVPSRDGLANDVASFLYYGLARLTYPQHPHVVISQLNLQTLAKVTVDYADAEKHGNRLALIEIVEAIDAGEFEPRPNGVCAWCPVRNFCPAFGPAVDFDTIM